MKEGNYLGNLIMPKQTAKLDKFLYSLEIFYQSFKSNDPDVPNSVFKQKMTDHFEDLRERNDGAKIVKQSEMTRYFGLAIRSYSNNTTTITDRGISFYDSYNNRNTDLCIDLIVESILNDSFGRHNTAIKSSDADVDPPKLFTRGMLDLDGITRSDLALLLYYTHDMQLSYEDACIELKRVRYSSSDATVIVAQEKVNKYGDPKFSVFLNNIGFCQLDTDRKYQLSSYVRLHYLGELSKLNIYNSTPAVIRCSNPTMFEDLSKDTKDTDCNSTYKDNVSQTIAYDMNSVTFERQNNRIPENTGNNVKSNRYPTDTRLAKTALLLAGYQCELDNSHVTFTSKNDTQFMEAHHLIPMTAQVDFTVNLDRVENIVSLCPNCHSAIHYGNDSERKLIMTKLYNERREKLENVNLEIDVNSLFSKYYK